MITRRSKICLLFCGGAALSLENKILAVTKKEEMKPWLKAMPELNIMAEIEPVFVYGQYASEITPELWTKLAAEIYKRYHQFDGFVITHGLDTIIYTASALSFIFQDLSKPIVFTGSPLPSDTQKVKLDGLISDYRGLGIKANLINAIQVATMDIAEVGIMFGNRLVRANLAVKSELPTFNFFDSYAREYLGKVDFGIRLLDKIVKREKRKLKYQPKINKAVCSMQLYPGISPKVFEQMLGQGCQAMIVKTYHSNLFPDNFQPILKKARQNNIPIVAYNPFSLDIKKKKLEYISINEMTFETTLVKLMWALSQVKTIEEVRSLLKQDVAGEIVRR